MLEVSSLPEARPLPPSWVRLELDDFSSHASYPAIVQEIKAGWINFYGKLPGEETEQRSLSSIVRELVETKAESEKVILVWLDCQIDISRLVFQLRRLTVLSAREKDSYMSDMISLLSNFKFGWLNLYLSISQSYIAFLLRSQCGHLYSDQSLSPR